MTRQNVQMSLVGESVQRPDCCAGVACCTLSYEPWADRPRVGVATDESVPGGNRVILVKGVANVSESVTRRVYYAGLTG